MGGPGFLLVVSELQTACWFTVRSVVHFVALLHCVRLLCAMVSGCPPPGLDPHPPPPGVGVGHRQCLP